MSRKFELPDHLTRRVEARLEAGQFESAAAVLEAGLDALDAQDAYRREQRQKLAALREALQEGLDDQAPEDGELVIARISAKYGLAPLP